MEATIAEQPVVTEVQTQEAPVSGKSLGSILDAALSPKDSAALDALKQNLPEEAPPQKDDSPPKQPDAKDKAEQPAETKPLDELEKAGLEEDPDLPKLPIDELNEEPEAADTDIPSDKVGAAMKKLREEKRDISRLLETKAAELQQAEARLAELDAKAKLVEDYERQIEEYEKRMSVVKIEETKAFREKVRDPLVKISNELEAIAKKHDLDYDALADAMEIEDGDAAEAKINELVSGMSLPVTDIVKLINLRGQTQPVLKARADMYANADNMLAEVKALDERQSEEQILERVRERERLFPKVADRMNKLVPFFADQFNSVRENVAATDPDALDTSEKVYNAIAGKSLPKIAKAFADAIKERDELLDELAGYRDAKPGGGTSAPNQTAKPPSSLNEALAQAFG